MEKIKTKQFIGHLGAPLLRAKKIFENFFNLAKQIKNTKEIQKKIRIFIIIYLQQKNSKKIQKIIQKN